MNSRNHTYPAPSPSARMLSIRDLLGCGVHARGWVPSLSERVEVDMSSFSPISSDRRTCSLLPAVHPNLALPSRRAWLERARSDKCLGGMRRANLAERWNGGGSTQDRPKLLRTPSISLAVDVRRTFHMTIVSHGHVEHLTRGRAE